MSTTAVVWTLHACRFSISRPSQVKYPINSHHQAFKSAIPLGVEFSPHIFTLLCFQQHLRYQKVWSGWSWTIKTQASTPSIIKMRAGLHWEKLYPKMSACSPRRTAPHSYTTSLLCQSQYMWFYQAMFYSPVSYLLVSFEEYSPIHDSPVASTDLDVFPSFMC